MKTPTLIIDPFIREPVNSNFNRLVTIFAPKPCFIWQPSLHHRLPDSLLEQKLDSIVLLGSAGHVSEKRPWYPLLKKFLFQKLKTNTPVLGICFGHQFMAKHFGCKVNFVFDDQDIIRSTRKFKLKKWGEMIAGVSHRQIVYKISSQMECLAERSQRENDPFQYDLLRHKEFPYLGAQLHLEASVDFLKKSCHIRSKDTIEQCLSSGEIFFKNWKSLLR